MSDATAGLLQAAALLAALAVCYRPFGTYMARVYDSERHLRGEQVIYRVMGVDPDADQRWPTYARSLLAFSLVGVLGLYALQRLQAHLPLSSGRTGVPPDQAFNTAASFVTNTNWQSYSGETVMGHLAQMSGLAVQNFVSAATGMAVAVALVRGFARSGTDRVGNFWVDLVRGSLRILLPISVVAGLALVALGTPQNLSSGTTAHALAGHSQSLPGGPVASQEVIKLLGTNGGGFYNANSAHPFENPTALTNLLEIFLVLLIPVCLTHTFGRMVHDRRQGRAVLGVMVTLAGTALVAMSWLERAHPGAAMRVAGAAMEGKETRFGELASTLFAASTTGTSTGAVNSFHSSFTALGGGLTMFLMSLGEVAPGGVGSGLYGILVLAVVAVFVAGLMVGRTPEYLRKKVTAREIKLVALYILVMPVLVLAGAGLAVALPGPRSAMLNSGPHGLSEILYAFLSAGNNNGSAFAGLSANTPFYNTALGLLMLLVRFVPIALVLALAGSLAAQPRVPVTDGTLPTHRPLFVALLTGVVVVVAGLTFFPALTLGPLAEGL